MALALLMVSATPVPPDPNWRQGPVAALKMQEPTPVAVAPVMEKRQFSGDRMPASHGFMDLPPMYTQPLFSGKLPFEYISGPYESNSVYGQPFQGGPFGGLGVPLSNGPLGGVMSIPLLALMNMG